MLTSSYQADVIDYTGIATQQLGRNNLEILAFWF